MSTKKINIIGLMSGTSLDGLDLVYVTFDKKSYENFEIQYSETIAYSKLWKEKLAKAIDKSDEELQELDLEYGKLLAKKVNSFIKKNRIINIDFIASHGHTVLHQPEKGITLQIGDGQTLANETQQKVVCDFRTQDVKLGGQGAPLVPIGDEFLFHQYDTCLNLGGFANVSFKEQNKRIAFDICPVNIVLNYYVNTLGFDYDNKGKIASTGIINTKLLEELNSLNYYKTKPPKSLGLEWVQSTIIPLIDDKNLEIKDVLATFMEHVAIQIAASTKKCKNIFITGGGVFNEFLIKRINHHSNLEMIIPNSQIVNYKEALIFAFLGLLRVDNQVNCLSSVTGAKKDHSSGVIFTS
ncbi:Anhydro-N-acetylmuramic acid kinase [Polaribacter huanghezhanensis]|uniref:anhydro-N-acetylmuramic acid kinase n=1 Tax=Polaribacter huanghezhanensis TaxID=1354726 RepID=UPI0026488D78|nr:anhydro-N-acetylmuramic acid kinase [Polaribacter huanghezhanensis]WKD86078.1 Anhydro-N-acetylmuramic acid kinase [Polaribacter huanghezhanensis]